MPPLFNTAVKDKCAINILFSEVYCSHFGCATLFFFCNYNWYVSIWSIKFVSPLTTRISVFASSPACRLWCSNSPQSARSLGVIFDEHMSPHTHVSSICRSSFYDLRNLSRIKKYFTKESAAVAVHAFVTSKLGYCNELLYGLPKYQCYEKLSK